MASVYNTGVQPYQLYSEEKPYEGINYFMIRSLHQSPDAVNTRFFNSNNVDVLQKTLRETIKAKTGYLIDRQADDQLLIIMRGCYIENNIDRTLPPMEQVSQLNAMTVRICLPQIASGLKQYLGYLKDASSLPSPISRSVNTSVKGSRTLELHVGL